MHTCSIEASCPKQGHKRPAARAVAARAAAATQCQPHVGRCQYTTQHLCTSSTHHLVERLAAPLQVSITHARMSRTVGIHAEARHVATHQAIAYGHIHGAHKEVVEPQVDQVAHKLQAGARAGIRKEDVETGSVCDLLLDCPGLTPLALGEGCWRTLGCCREAMVWVHLGGAT